MKALLLVMASGAVGASTRWLAGGLAQRAGERWLGTAFPYGTFFVNVVGCFAFGLATALLAGRLRLGTDGKLVLLTGFMGSFTTFSTYGSDLHGLLAGGRYGAFAVAFAGQNALGILAVAGGLALGRVLSVW